MGRGRRNHGTMKGGHQPHSETTHQKGTIRGGTVGDTQGAGSSGYEDKRTDWSNTGDRGNDYVTKGDTDKNKDKNDASRTGEREGI